LSVWKREKTLGRKEIEKWPRKTSPGEEGFRGKLGKGRGTSTKKGAKKNVRVSARKHVCSGERTLRETKKQKGTFGQKDAEEPNGTHGGRGSLKHQEEGEGRGDKL